jgi:hypothetical protein
MPELFEALEERTFLSADTYVCSRGHTHSVTEEAQLATASTGKSGATIAARSVSATAADEVGPAKSGRTIAARGSTGVSRGKSGKTLAARAAAEAATLLKVSPDGHYLVHGDGTPFFYMADSAWHLFNKLSDSDADLYLETRAKQGFTVIQAEINARFDTSVNVTKQLVFINNDPTRPNEAFFRHVDYIVNKANSLGMYVSMVPLDTKWARAGKFSLADAYNIGRYMGERYKNAKIIWTIGADIGALDVPQGLGLWRELAAGIARGAANRDMSKVLMQYHPLRGQTSSDWFQDDAWLDMNAFQSGHNSNPTNYDAAAADYALSPARPVMDVETSYEEMPDGVQIGARRLNDYDVRKAEYWSLFAGSHGVTYGDNNVWQFVVEPGQTRNLANKVWKDALNTPGAKSMTILKRLMLSRPYLDRIPDQSVVVGDTLSGTNHIQATRASDGSYAFVYTAGGQPVRVDLSKISGPSVTARWFNPRTGETTMIGNFGRKHGGTRTLAPPTTGTDWVLILDDASKNYANP